jgi:hypothetical protein
MIPAKYCYLCGKEVGTFDSNTIEFCNDKCLKKWYRVNAFEEQVDRN